MGLGQQIGEALFAKDEKIKELEAEVDRLRAAILSFGNGNDFDWNVLGRIEELELENEWLRILAERAYPGLLASGFCSAHQESGHYECKTCYPDLRAMLNLNAKVSAKLRVENERLGKQIEHLEDLIVWNDR